MTFAAPATIRHEKAKRAAVRATLAGARLDPKQLKLAVAAHDALCAKSRALSAQADTAFNRASDGASNTVLTAVGWRLDQIEKQSEPFDTRAQALRAHPQVRVAILAREKAEERKQ